MKYSAISIGAVSERLKEMVSKTIELVRVPGVRIPPAPNEVIYSFIGEMTERPKVHDWKSCVPGRVPRVQIPLSPLFYLSS